MLLPKSVGETYMVSGYQSCEFALGLGKLLNENVLEAVNQERERERYNQRKMLSFYTIHQKNQDLRKTHQYNTFILEITTIDTGVVNMQKYI